MKMDATTLLGGVILILLLKWIWDRKQRQWKFQRRGVKGPKPRLILGNLNTIREKGFKKAIQDWPLEYGKTMVYHEGAIPIVLTADVELIKEYAIKQFRKFSTRKVMPLLKMPKGYNAVTEVDYDEWRPIRTIMSPTFSALRMRQMSPIINMCADRFLKSIKNMAGPEPFDVYHYLTGYTLDVITTCAFGFDPEAITAEEQKFLKKVTDIFKYLDKSIRAMRIIFIINVINEKLASFLVKYFKKMFMPPLMEPLMRTVAEIVTMRKANKVKKADFLQLLMDSSETNIDLKDLEAKLDDEEKEEHRKENINNKHKQSGRKFTNLELEAQSAQFLLAGYETTSTALSFMVHNLATNQKVQEKLQAEVDEHFPDKADCRPDYVTLKKLHYLDMVIHENLRCHVIGELGRIKVCVEDCTIRGIPFEKGDCIQPAVYRVHHDPEHWGPEPTDLFVPERFLPHRVQNRDACAYIPFGAGPRNCIGMRFSLMEQKVFLVRLLREYTIAPCSLTPCELETKTNGIYGPKDGVYVKLIPRDQ